MREILVPPTVEAYRDDFMERALPDERLANSDFYTRLTNWVIDHRTPLLYRQDHPDEYTNFSINFNWLLLRDYTDTKLGPPSTIAAMYALHEMTHMTHRLPTRLDEITAAEYAEDFTKSEYRASNETEILIHYRIPELRQLVFPGLKIAFDILKERSVPQPSAHLLSLIRPLAVETDLLLPLVEDNPEDVQVLERFQRFNGNREWATDRFKTIRRFFTAEYPQSRGLTDREYESVVETYEPQITQEVYERHIMRNVKFGYAMCGLKVPFIGSFADAIDKSKELEGQHAIVQS